MIGAVVPAAGQSARMGRPKLLLSFDGETVIARVVKALRAGGAGRVIVVAPPESSPEGPAIAAESARAGAEVVAPATRPTEMRDSIELGLAALARGAAIERVLLAPGDSPGITPELVAQLLECAARLPESIVVPCFKGRRGHPLVMPWELALLVRALPEGLGVNALAGRYPDRRVELEISESEMIADLDTPADLRRWNSRQRTDERAGEERARRGEAAPGGAAGNLHVQVRLFALAKERVGRAVIDLELPVGSRVAGVRIALGERFPAIAPLMQTALFAINEEYAGDDAPILAGSRIAVIPPVSGGVGIGR
jgi:molybdenum cofactor cytidylyltransferase